MQRLRVCLSAIVRNESANVNRLLDSLDGVIDEFVIVDTGSTDNTVELLENHPIPGIVLQREFDNFGNARTHAWKMCVKHATADWVLLLDADMVWVGGALTSAIEDADVVSVEQRGSGLSYHNVRLIRRSLKPVSCIGATHEYWSTPDTARSMNLATHWIDDRGDGGCKKDKFERDLRLLESYKPRNARTVFYMAQTHEALGNWQKALLLYLKRMRMTNSFELERNYARFRALACHLKLNQRADAEKLFTGTKSDCLELATHLRNKNDHHAAMVYACKGILAPDESHVLFRDTTVHTRLMFERTVLWHYVYPDLPVVGMTISMNLLLYENLDDTHQQTVWRNMRFYVQPARLTDIRRITDSGELGWRPSTPSSPDFVRYVNYSIDSSGRYIVDGPVRSKIQNITVHTDYFPENHVHPDASCLGIEDVRIGPEGRVLCSSLEFTHTKGTVSQVTGILRGNDLWLDHVIPSNKHEKNWVFCGDMVVYGWWPKIRIGVVTPEGFVETMSIRVPLSFKGMRGSSNGVDMGDRWSFITHTAIDTPGEKRQYVHQVVHVSKDLDAVLSYSLPFTFTGNDVEFCMHFTSDWEVGFSERDNSTVFAKLERDFLHFIPVLA